MRNLCLCLMAACTSEPSSDPVSDYDALALVDPMIGTGGVGAEVIGLNPGAATPFGMVHVGPETRSTTTGQPGFMHFGGYHHDDDRIDGFAHTHAAGMGVNDLGGVVLLPRARWTPEMTRIAARTAPFRHDTERAEPGLYAVTLDDDGTRVEVTASTRGAVHRWTFQDAAAPVAVLDLGYHIGGIEIGEASIQVDGATLLAFQDVRGSYSGRAGGLPHHVYATFDPPPIGSGVWSAPDEPHEGTEANGPLAGAWLTFPPGTKVVTARVALSFTGPEGAKVNHAAELEGRSFEQVHQTARAAWRDQLDRARARGGTDEERTIFHTALYHAALWPMRYQDADGTYRGFDGALHVSDQPYYSAFSLWDTFRTTHPLLTLMAPDQHEPMLRSLLVMAEQGGDLPRWPIGAGYTGGMIGSPGAIVLAEAHLKGLDLGDSEAAFDHAVASALAPRNHAGRDGLEAYQDLGWVPLDEVGGAASKTLEYAWADHALSSWARDLGRTDLALTLERQAQGWRTTWDPQDRFFLGRNRDGTFPRRYNSETWSRDFIEGTAWQYRFGVPFDVAGMVEVQNNGDADAFLDDLGDFWDQARAEPDDFAFDSFYWHGNEPDLHYAWLGAMVGDSRMTHDAVRWIRETRYNTTPAGLDGNDDAGTLSAWYVLAAAGLYPIAGTDLVVLGEPLFERLELGGLTVRRQGDGAQVVEVRVGDALFEGGVIHHAQLLDAGEIVFVMGP